MKKIITLLLINFIQFSYSQKVIGNKVIYKLLDDSYEIRAKKTNGFRNKILSEISDVRKKLNFELIYNKNKSAFYLQDIDIPNLEDGIIPLASNILNIGEFYYKDNEKAYYYKDYDDLEEYFKIDQSNVDYEWEIKNETKKILGYTCNKAIGYNHLDIHYGDLAEITAWYTTELPNGFGPKNYGNLPGVILEATIYTRKKVTYKAVQVEKNVKIRFPKEKKAKKVFTPEGFWKFHQEVSDMKYGNN